MEEKWFSRSLSWLQPSARHQGLRQAAQFVSVEKEERYLKGKKLEGYRNRKIVETKKTYNLNHCRTQKEVLYTIYFGIIAI